MDIDPVVTWISTLAPAAILGAAGFNKLADSRAFRAIVANYGVLPPILVTPVAYALPYVELGAALGLLIPGTRRMAAVVALVLLAIFTCALIVNLLRGRRDLDCGCHFGGARTALSGGLVLRNGLLLLWIVPAASAEAVSRALSWLDAVTIMAGSALGVLAYMMSGELLALRRAAPVGPASAGHPRLSE